MIPYYEDDLVTLWNADCGDAIPEQVADVLITDPPYGVGLTAKKTKHRETAASSTYDDDPDEIRYLIGRVIPMALEVSGGRGLVFSGPAMLWAYPEPAAVGCVFCPNGAGSSSWGFQCLHPVLFYGKDPYLADGLGRRPNGFSSTASLEQQFDHPCPKPMAWMNWAVNRASRVGETILDPFAGTGTTLVAAKRLGRKAVGIEIDEHYCEIAAGRLSQGVLFEAAS